MAATYLKLFVDCLEKYEALNDNEFGRLVRAALLYKKTGQEAGNMGREALLWPGMRLDIDRDNEAYARTVKARSDAGKMGGRPKSNDKQKKQMLFQESKKSQDKDKEEEKDKDKDFSKENTKEKAAKPPSASRFTPPTLDEVKSYCQERENGVDPERFFDFYSAKGWMIGKNRMKDWKAAVRAWEKDSTPGRKEIAPEWMKRHAGRVKADQMNEDAWAYVNRDTERAETLKKDLQA